MGEEIATRDAGKQVMQAFKDAVPTMIGGAADLVESTKTEFEGGGLFSDRWVGRNIAFGIREHAMGSIVNGIAVHGGCVKPYGSTFLIFSDYMRPAVRLSALMGLPVVWAWTHDSVGLGEDGPTHQPVETYAALRAIPNLWFVRPADANETAYAWKVALERTDGPVALSLSRQKVPTLDRSELAPASGLERGAYTLWESAESPELILISTGAEVGLTLEAGRKIAAEGTAVRVVSMPCWELFADQPCRLSRRGAAARRARAALGRAGGRARLEQMGRRPRRLDLDRALRRLGARAAPSWNSSATTSTTWSRARPRCWSGSPHETGRRDQGRSSRSSRRGSAWRESCRPCTSRGSRSGTTGMRSRWCRPTAGRCRSASPSTRGRSPASRFYDGVAVAFDHRGVHLREAVLEVLAGHEILDFGTDTDAVRIDYPDKAREVGEAIQRGEAERGILVCGSGVGAAVAACKLTGIRAAICHDSYSAHQGVEHDDMNVLCLGSEVVGPSLARELVDAFLNATFNGGERYVARLLKVAEMEREMKDG